MVELHANMQKCMHASMQMGENVKAGFAPLLLYYFVTSAHLLLRAIAPLLLYYFAPLFRCYRALWNDYIEYLYVIRII